LKVKSDKKALDKLNKILKKVKDKDIGKSVNQSAIWFYGIIAQRKLTGQVLNVRSNQLRGGFYVKKVGKNEYELINRMVYAAIHEFGGEIRPKNAEYLNFRTDRGYVRTKKVTIPERSYVRTSIREYWNELLNQYSKYLWEKI